MNSGPGNGKCAGIRSVGVGTLWPERPTRDNAAARGFLRYPPFLQTHSGFKWGRGWNTPLSGRAFLCVSVPLWCPFPIRDGYGAAERPIPNQ